VGPEVFAEAEDARPDLVGRDVGPMDSTTPANSPPRIAAFGLTTPVNPRMKKGFAPRIPQSVRVTEVTWTRTRRSRGRPSARRPRRPARPPAGRSWSEPRPSSAHTLRRAGTAVPDG
jgi:hypothetical protein